MHRARGGREEENGELVAGNERACGSPLIGRAEWTEEDSVDPIFMKGYRCRHRGSAGAAAARLSAPCALALSPVQFRAAADAGRA